MEGGEEGEEQKLRDTLNSLFNFPRGTYLILPCLFTSLSIVSLLQENESWIYTAKKAADWNAKGYIYPDSIINTTLYPDELAARYTSSICSRLNGFYKTIHFAGSDIRSILKTRR